MLIQCLESKYILLEGLYHNFFFFERIVKDVAIYTCMCIVWLDMKIPVYICD